MTKIDAFTLLRHLQDKVTDAVLQEMHYSEAHDYLAALRYKLRVEIYKELYALVKGLDEHAEEAKAEKRSEEDGN